MTLTIFRPRLSMLKSSRQSYSFSGGDVPTWRALSIKEASEISGYNEEHLRRLVRAGKIESARIGRVYLIRADSLERFMEEVSSSDDARLGPRQK